MESGDHSSRLAVSRVLLLGWCLWLLASWATNLAIFPARRSWIVHGDMLAWRAPAEAFIPVVRAMLISVAVGLILIWPAWRLSMAPSGGERHAGRETAIDLVALWLIIQVVVLPMRLLADLSLARLGLISLTFAIWGAATATLVWLGRRPRGPEGRGSTFARTAAMLGCAALLLGGWPIAYILGDTAPADFSPLHTLWTLCAGSPDPAAILIRLAIVLGATIIVWVAALTWRSQRTQSGRSG